MVIRTPRLITFLKKIPKTKQHLNAGKWMSTLLFKIKELKNTSLGLKV